MCGIAGAVGSCTAATVEAMAQKIAHRGPDSLSTLSYGNVHFAHARLSIIDLSPDSNQPLWDAKKQACIVFNGEIYNFQILKQELVSKGYTFNSKGDAEVLLNLYIEHGEKLFDKVSGIFSFAIWDEAKKRLMIARDNYGVKPLYYVQNTDGFYFASEIKSLLEVKSIKRDLNFDSLLLTLIFLWSPGEETLFSEVKKLKPAHYVFVEEGVIVDYQPYWQWPEYSPTKESITTKTDAVFNALEMAVKEQLVADVPIGAFLSGGLDSSLIVSLAMKHSTAKINCFTIDAKTDKKNEGFVDDLCYAKRVAKMVDTELDIVSVKPDVVSLLPKMIYHLDELQADPAPLNVLLITELAKSKNIKVLLSGAGGDDVFSGYRRHYAVRLEKYWCWLPSSIRKFFVFSTAHFSKKNVFLRRLAKAFRYADRAQNERLLSYFYWLDPAVAISLFSDSIQKKLSDSPMKFMLDELAQLQTNDPLEKMLYLEQKYFLVDHNLNYTDKMSMANGVEVRVPFLDKNVIQVVAKISSGLKQKGRCGKWLLKRAAEKILPRDIIYRPKTGFGAPLRTWLQTDLVHLVDRYLSVDMLNKRGIFNPSKVQELIQKDRSGQEDYSYSIFGLLCFEIWCQQFLDPSPLSSKIQHESVEDPIGVFI